MVYDFRKPIKQGQIFKFPECVDVTWLGQQRTVIQHYRRDPAALIYSEQIHYDFENIKSVLPLEVEAYADIGCGLGGIDVLLYRHWQPKRIYLCEIKPHVLECAKEFLRLNEVGAELVELSPSFKQLPEDVSFVISLFAMGCHFPYRKLNVPHIIDVHQADYGPIKGRRLYSDGFQYTRVYIR